ncbi:MAG: 50S ribosomal protein L24 [Deltaproteobacteria bacterium]|nr:50S ribosomal protein L24 [Nannocystaceae bacterium]
MERVRQGDTVVVIAGKQKGTKGRVLRVIPKDDRAVIEGVNVRTKHVKPTQANPQGGRVKREYPIHLSNVMLADPKTGEPTRVRVSTLTDGRRVRIAVKSGEQIDK